MVYNKLQAVRVELQKMPLKKSGKNKHIGFEYFELGDFLPTAMELFLKHNLSSNFSIMGNVATLTVVDLEDKTEALFTTPTADATLQGKPSPVQELGAMHTYIRRYLYVNALEIIENDVVDQTLGNKEDDEPKATKEQVSKILGILNANPEKVVEWTEALLERYNVQKLNDLTMKQASEIIKYAADKQKK